MSDALRSEAARLREQAAADYAETIGFEKEEMECR